MPKLYVFELDSVIWDANGSIFERRPPFTLVSPFVIKDAEGVEIRLDETVFTLFDWFRQRRHYISISRYHKEDLVFSILEQFKLLDYLVFIEVEWDKSRGGYIKKVYDSERKTASEISQKDIFFVDNKSGYLSYLALYYKSKKQYEKSIECLKKSIELNPRLCSSYFSIGSIYYSYLQQFENALRYYKKAYKLQPDDPKILVNIAHAYNKLGEPNRAIKYLNNKIKHFNHSEMWLQLGLNYEKINDLENAEKCYRKSMNIDPNYKSAKLFLVLIFWKSNRQLNSHDLEICRDVISDIENKQQKDLVDYMNLASGYKMLDDIPRSIKCFEMILELNPKDSDVWTLLGTMYEQQDQLLRSKNCYERAIEIDATNEKAQLNLTSLKERLIL